MDDRQEIAAVDVIKKIEGTVQIAMQIAHVSGIGSTLPTAMSNDPYVIDPFVADYSFVGVGDETAHVR